MHFVAGSLFRSVCISRVSHPYGEVDVVSEIVQLRMFCHIPRKRNIYLQYVRIKNPKGIQITHSLYESPYDAPTSLFARSRPFHLSVIHGYNHPIDTCSHCSYLKPPDAHI